LVRLAASGEEKAGVWTLDVKVSAPKIVEMNVPGRGERTILYVEYEITNKTDKPREVSPVWRLISDKNEKEIADEVLPAVQDKLGAGRGNSVTVRKKPVAPGETRRAIAIWDGIDARASRFTISVRGMSNGFVVEGGKTKFKTLQTRFERTDR